MRLGVIADDFTGATDIAGFLVANGLKTVQLNGVPQKDLSVQADAVVISLKTRSCPVDEAIEQSLAALKWLEANDCKQYFFKYCSTFDSTLQGNIGPVTDALLAALGESMTIICPALPVNGRTIYNGYLFVNSVLLSESGMRHHPVTPMTDSNLMRVMQAQSKGKAGNISYDTIEKGIDAVKVALEVNKSNNINYVVLDALNNNHLSIIGQAISSMKLLTGGSGLADGLARAYGFDRNNIYEVEAAGAPQSGKTIILSGSCSQMTNSQVENYKKIAASIQVDIEKAINDKNYYNELVNWILEQPNDGLAPLVFATMAPDKLKNIQEKFGKQKSSEAIEQLFALIAIELSKNDFVRFIVAGGETSGSVTQALNIEGFAIGPQIAPGVPWVKAIGKPLSLALKSGNFGNEEFFTVAQKLN